MPASAARRRLGAIVPLFVAAAFASGALLAPTASASGSSLPATAQLTAQQGVHPDALTIRQKADHAADIAISHIGDPYRYGAAGPNAFDCSGLTMWSYNHAGLSLPRTSSAQYAAVRHIAKKNLMRGDLVAFHDSSGHVYHVGLFLYWNADHRAVIIHAPRTGTVVHRAPVWTSAWYAGTRRP